MVDGTGERWEITSEQRRVVVDAMVAIATSDDWRCAIAAARILIQMDLANLKWTEQESQRKAELIRELQRRASRG